jgi:hypothetical protein
MKGIRRRKFLKNVSLGVGAAVLESNTAPAAPNADSETRDETSETTTLHVEEPATAIDFRYSPLSWQAVYSFPNDHLKSLVGSRGELLCGNPGLLEYWNQYFPEVVEFSVLGMESNRLMGQRLERPGVPIVHTQISRPEAFLELTTFATNREDEGRVDNVILDIRPRSRKRVHATPEVTIKTKRTLKVQSSGTASLIALEGEASPLFLAVDRPFAEQIDLGSGWRLYFEAGVSSDAQSLRCFFRFPRQAQDFGKLQNDLANPLQLLEEARAYWQNWKPFAGGVDWRLPGRYGEFLVACARDIQQEREVKKGNLTFQIGPTVYRNLWALDANFILEAARYLGYDADAQRGLETEWTYQQADGQIVAGGGPQFWKGTAIAVFTLVRQAELSQDWSYFRKMQPDVLRGIEFLMNLRAQARKQGGIMGRYGLLPPGFGDGGLAGVAPEFTNTLWVLAGLKAVIGAANQLGMSGFGATKQFYKELRASFFAAARQEMRSIPAGPAGLQYLPMLMKEDPQWSAPDFWVRPSPQSTRWVNFFQSDYLTWRTPVERPRPQVAQWAMANAIYPGRLFSKDDPIVRGYFALMQSCTQEDVPVETGWLHHGGLWAYDAAYAAHAFLWAGLKDWARSLFTGFLNHASPLYAWREEQPLQASMVAGYSGDMPDATADAECILYLRHMLALEDGPALRLVEGMGDFELAPRMPYQLAGSPTRFGRVSLNLEPLERNGGWRLKFAREKGPVPEIVQLPATLGTALRFADLQGAGFTRNESAIEVSPESRAWEARWELRGNQSPQ